MKYHNRTFVLCGVAFLLSVSSARGGEPEEKEGLCLPLCNRTKTETTLGTCKAIIPACGLVTKISACRANFTPRFTFPPFPWLQKCLGYEVRDKYTVHDPRYSHSDFDNKWPRISPFAHGPSSATPAQLRTVLAFYDDYARLAQECHDFVDKCQKNYVPSPTIEQRVGKSLLDAWNNLKAGNLCPVMVAAVELSSPINLLATEAINKALGKPLPGEKCIKAFKEGFVCDIPDAVKDVAIVISGSLREAWRNRRVCGPAAVLGLGAGLLCGTGYYLAGYGKRLWNCVSKMPLRHILLTLAEGTSEAGCKIAGGLALDAVIEILTAGTGTAALVAKWAGKLKGVLDVVMLNKLAKSMGVGVELAKKFTEENLKNFWKECNKP
ncbi:MAG: hypothetical protein HYY84_12245 [Deltaproteobacteria bacterium]|nr:hypothetical protein [Deltaproteobacteria bacterium]